VRGRRVVVGLLDLSVNMTLILINFIFHCYPMTGISKKLVFFVFLIFFPPGDGATDTGAAAAAAGVVAAF